MTDEPPDQPPDQPSGHPAQQPGQGTPATEPMSAATGDPAASPSTPPVASPSAPTTNSWHRATSTNAGRWGIAIAAGALAVLMLLGVGVAGLLALRNHDRFGLMGQRQDGFSRGQLDQGDGRGPGGRDGYRPLQPGMPGMRGGAQGLRGFGGAALHGSVTANVNGTVQSLVFQRGEVTAVSATSITLKSSDGFVGTYGRTGATNSVMGAPATGGRAFVLARASDKVAITIMAAGANAGVAPSN